ncbi:MAG: hypothetical protein QM757_30960, partial [Paludibaculum sp.]
IRDARGQNLRLILLWFATWKNGVMELRPGLGEEQTTGSIRECLIPAASPSGSSRPTAKQP